VELRPSEGPQNFDLRGSSQEVLEQVARAYGIRAVLHDSVQRKQIRFSIQNVTYEQAMGALLKMAHAFAVAVDPTTVLVANEDGGNRARLGRQLEETIEVPGATQDQLNELINVIRQIFDVRQAIVQTSGGRILVRAPEEIFGPLNATLAGLVQNNGEVTIEVKLFEITTSKKRSIGATLPSQFTVFNVDQAATQIVTQNQSLVQQAIAQGYISANASNLQIALALIGAGLVQSNLANNLIGVFGGGTLQTGVAASSGVTLNLALNSSETRAMDDVLLRVGDRKDATFREGTRYPIVTSTYTTGISTAPSSLSNASINGVNVANLISQFAGGTSATIPQVTYEDLGLTLNAKPAIQRSGRVQMHLDMKIQSLSGQSLDGNPVLLNRQMASDLSLGDGESAIMVSSVSKTETAALTGIPGISELPGFQMPTQKSTERDTEQLVIVVTPHVARERTVDSAGPRMVVSTGISTP
jgi:Flp pilus assembly secretin CpaC